MAKTVRVTTYGTADFTEWWTFKAPDNWESSGNLREDFDNLLALACPEEIKTATNNERDREVECIEVIDGG